MTENLNLKTVDTVDTRPFRKLVMTIGELPSAFVESMTYYELLAWFTNYLETVIIPTVNNNGEAVEELQDKFVELKNDTETEISSFETEITATFNQLKDFVDNYFDNLDVQEEINNKLDDMAEEGTLQEIITTYIQSNVAWTFDTVAEMQTATNLIDGSYARTLGYYQVNDGGGALYRISENAPSKYYETLNSGLYAELIEDGTHNVKQYGIKADGETDNSTKLNTLLTSGLTKIYFPNGTYYLGSSITVPETCTYISGEEMDKTILECAGDGFIFENPSLITVRCMLLQKKLPRHQNIGMQGAFRSSSFEYLKLQGFEKGMLVSGDSWSNLYLRCKFAYCDYGYYKDNIGETDWNDFWKCGFTDNTVCGFYLNGNNYNNTLFSCDFERNAHAVQAGYSPQNLVIDRGYFTNNSNIFSVIGGFSNSADVTIQNAWINQPEIVDYTHGWLVLGRTMASNTPQGKTSSITVKGCNIFLHNTNIKPFAFDDHVINNPMSMIVFNIYDNVYDGNSGVVPNNYPTEYFDLIDTTNYPRYLGIDFRPSVKTDLMYKNLNTHLHWKIDNMGVTNGFSKASNLFHMFGYYEFTSTGEYNVSFNIDTTVAPYDTYTSGKLSGVVRYTDGSVDVKAISILTDKIYVYGLDPAKTTSLISLDVWYGGDSRTF